MNDLNYDGPVVLVILDGVGIRKNPEGNAVLAAHTEFLDRAMLEYPSILLKASGEAVGILPGQMGNSEVGHTTIGTGQIIKQGIAKIEDDFKSGAIWQSEAWRGAIENVKNTNGTLHFSGIFSDGGVHSSISHLEKMLERAASDGVQKIRLHIILDGRDVAPQSAEKYIAEIRDFIAKLKARYPNLDFEIASGGGRMVFISDRYESDWGIVKNGYDALVHGVADHTFKSAEEAMTYFRQNLPDVIDQYLPSFVIVNSNNQPVGKVQDGDSFIFYDFRADRAIEIAQAFTYNDFPYFDRATHNLDGSVTNRRLDVYFAGMTEYNSDTHVPEHQLVPPASPANSLHEFLHAKGISQLAIAETVKFGHITYYFNGNSYEVYENEENINIQSDTRPFNERPWMKSAEITDVLLNKLDEKDSEGKPRFKFARVNFAGGDMVGHFGDFEATVVALEAIDLQLARIAKKVDELGGVMVITADHGNAEELIDDTTHEPKTSHSTSLVPCVFYDNTKNRERYQVIESEDAGLANLASTVAELLGQSDYPGIWEKPLIRAKK